MRQHVILLGARGLFRIAATAAASKRPTSTLATGCSEAVIFFNSSTARSTARKGNPETVTSWPQKCGPSSGETGHRHVRGRFT